MFITISRKDLLTALRKTHGVVGKSASSSYMIEAKGNEAYIEGTDLEVWFRYYFPAVVFESGSTTIPQYILSVLKSLPKETTISLKAEPLDESQTKIIIKGTKFYIEIFDTGEFPIMEQKLVNSVIKIDSFMDMIEKVLFAVSTEKTGSPLEGVLLSFDDTFVKLVASDGHRLALVRKKFDHLTIEETEKTENANLHRQAGQQTSDQAIVPRRALEDLKRIKIKLTTVKFYNGRITFCAGKLQYTIRTMEGRFPNYDCVIPRKFSRIIQINRILFLRALERLYSLTKFVILQIRGKKMIISISSSILSSSIGKEESIEEEEESITWLYREKEEVLITHHKERKDMDIMFNVKYLIDACSAIDSEFVSLNMNGNTEAALITPWEESDYLCVVMPMELE